MKIVTQLDEYGFRREYSPCDPSPEEAAQAREYVRSQREAYRQIQRELDAATLEEQLTWQIEVNQAQIAANHALMAVA